ncbi:MAG TPA: glucosaminidase domain-containing protein [Bacteroidales bacterium]|nr:glucosaminidase domain-containing protein [Bacteroidales bacterium]
MRANIYRDHRPAACILGLVACIFFFPVPLWSQNSDYDEAVRRYIDAYQRIAVKEMQEFHIPASITLAQGIFESNAGRSTLAVEANNHFGIKCHKEWTGETIYQDDETKHECFRKYGCAEESFRDHSRFLSERDRYKSLFSLDMTDYKGWAKGLKETGYATNPAYADKLISTIEKYGLYRFDAAGFSVAYADSLGRLKDSLQKKTVSPPYEVFATGPGNRTVYLNNGLQFIILDAADNVHTLAKAFGVKEKKLLSWNDLKKGARLATGMMVYLEPKKRKGSSSYYEVRQEDTMYTVSQKTGIRLSSLYRKNKMSPGQTLHAGQRLLLR